MRCRHATPRHATPRHGSSLCAPLSRRTQFSDFMKSVDGSGEPEVAVEPTEPAIAEDAEGEAEEAAVEAAAGEATEAAAPAAEGTAVAAAEEEER